MHRSMVIRMAKTNETCKTSSISVQFVEAKGHAKFLENEVWRATMTAELGSE